MYTVRPSDGPEPKRRVLSRLGGAYVSSIAPGAGSSSLSWPITVGLHEYVRTRAAGSDPLDPRLSPLYGAHLRSCGEPPTGAPA